MKKPEPSDRCVDCKFYDRLGMTWGVCVNPKMKDYLDVEEPDVRDDFGCVLWQEKE